MKKELGKWLMDIAKYVTTAIILASFVGGLRELWLLYTVSILIALSTLVSGMLLYKRAEKDEKKK